MDNRYWENLNNQTGGQTPQQQQPDPITGEYRMTYGYDPQTGQQTQPEAQQQPVYSYTPSYGYNEPPKKEKKRKKYGKGFSAIIVVVCLIVSLAGGYAGASLANLNNSNSSNGGASVMYQSIDRVTDSTGNEPLTTADIVAMIQDSVVEITTEEQTSSYFFQQYVTTGAGSGVILSADGYIVTCAHVIEGASNITVKLNNGTSYPATVVGKPDAKSDIALLKINAKDLTPVVIGDSDKLVVGEDAIVIGNPLGSLGGTVTTGIISALGREVTVENTTMTLLQTSAAVNPGNSGGGIFNMRGELVGIVNAKSYGEDIEGLGFAIPSNDMREIIDQLIEVGYVSTPALGIMARWINSQEAAAEYGVERFGVYIEEVTEGAGAEAAGLQKDDYILSIDGTTISNLNDISTLLKNYKVGDTVEVQVIRDGETITVDLVLSELSA